MGVKAKFKKIGTELKSELTEGGKRLTAVLRNHENHGANGFSFGGFALGWGQVDHAAASGDLTPESLSGTKRKESDFIDKVGLFGVCGDSTWRKEAIPKFEAAGVDYFNPQVANWNPENAVEESRNLARDRVLLFPITKDTTAYGSLAESGWAALSAIKQGQKVGFFVEMYVTEGLDEKANAKTDTNRARKLVISHMKELLETHPELKESLILAENMDQLINWAIGQMKKQAN